MTPEFKPFPKIARYSRLVTVSEKIDGSNGSIHITEDGQFLTASRSQFITPEKDNHGFSRWAHEHRDELLTLGPGSHFGEWWGSSIQRGYGIKEKRFSLFNVKRWVLHGQEPKQIPTGDPRLVKMQQVLPPCVGLVPVLWEGMFDEINMYVNTVMTRLEVGGSVAAPGFMNPEGIVIFHSAGNVMFKKTFEKDDFGKEA